MYRHWFNHSPTETGFNHLPTKPVTTYWVNLGVIYTAFRLFISLTEVQNDLWEPLILHGYAQYNYYFCLLSWRIRLWNPILCPHWPSPQDFKYDGVVAMMRELHCVARQKTSDWEKMASPQLSGSMICHLLQYHLVNMLILWYLSCVLPHDNTLSYGMQWTL